MACASLWANVLSAAPNGHTLNRPVSRRVVRILAGDDISQRHISELCAGSAMARELMAGVEQLPQTILLLRANPLLLKTLKLYGRGRYWAQGGWLYGYLEYQTESFGDHHAQLILAHELAHALETSAAPRRSPAALRGFVLDRSLLDKPDPRGVETEFARVVTEGIRHEFLHQNAHMTVATVAARFGIVLPEQSVLAADNHAIR